ncbi:MAG TPA: SNF2-related protein, partial [Parachlamydiaceae bacterium]|nr:SNF2-related protein [Parachlamydiaceae bacterium]
MTIAFRLKIDQHESFSAGTLAILSSLPLTLAAVGRLIKGKEALQFLVQQEINFRKKTGLKPISPDTAISTFHVAYPQTLAALKLLAASGLLEFNGKGLACDFFGKCEFYYLIETTPDNHTTISGRIKQGDQDFALTDCDFISGGPPHYFIKGISLKFITTDISWKELSQAFISPATIDLKKLRENYGIGSDSDEDAPKLIFKGEKVDKIEKLPAVFPLLVLHDRMGAFADLWMEYSQPSNEEAFRVRLEDATVWIKDAKGKSILKRDLKAEKQWEQDLLETDFIHKNVSSTHYYCPIDKVAKSLTFLLEVGWKIEDSQGRSICRQTESSVAIDTQMEAFLVKGKIQYGDHEADIQNVVGAFNRRDRFVVLGAGAVGLLPTQSISEAISMAIEDGEIVHDGIKVNRNRFGTLAAALEMDKSIQCDSSFLDLKEKLLSFQGINERLPGTSFSGTLRPYQQVGVNWLAFLYEHHFHGLLADDMGLGKTVQVLAFLSQIEVAHPVLLVLPTSLIFNWKREIEKFLPGWPIFVQHGPDRTRDIAKLKSSKIILTSYTTLRLDLTLFQQIFYECIVLDEAQVIKNSRTQTAQTIYKLNSRFRLSLSGTPVENHLGEMWSHFRFLIPELFDDEQQFTA